MLRIHCVQLFYNLSDPGMEDMLYEVESVRRFVGLRLSGPLPDETTILNFRHLLEEHDLGEGLFKTINVHLETHRLPGFAIGDVIIVDCPSMTTSPQTHVVDSTDDRARERASPLRTIISPENAVIPVVLFSSSYWNASKPSLHTIGAQGWCMV